MPVKSSGSEGKGSTPKGPGAGKPAQPAGKPSTTGKPSGGNRDNNPPKGK